MTGRSTADSQYGQLANNSNLKCYSCQQTGHLAHKCPNKRKSAEKKVAQNTFTDSSTQMICFNCGLPGHFAPNCPQKKQQPVAAKPLDQITCYTCKQQGHYSTNCPQKQK